MPMRTNLPHASLIGLAFIEACDPASCVASVQALFCTVTHHAGYEAIDGMQLWRAYAASHPGVLSGGDEGTDERARAAIRAEEERHRIPAYVPMTMAGLMRRVEAQA